ncbi:MAG: thioredoxin domain-containing protein, partial [Gemmatimonadota bacterium]|nr:thioredoxin domain-containing protein [Gemmatimonadota bacterium]
DDARVLLAEVARAYVPSLVLAAGSGAAVAGLPLFEGRGGAVAATAYVCRGYACGQPAVRAAELRTQLQEGALAR